MHDPLIMSGARRHPAATWPSRRACASPATPPRSSQRLDIPVVGTLDGDAYADGGDRFWLDDTRWRSASATAPTARGAQALRSCSTPEGVHVETYDMPHDQGPDYVLHLQSFLSAATEDLFVIYEPLAPVRLLQDIRERGIDWVAIDHDSYRRWAATSSPSGPAWW